MVAELTTCACLFAQPDRRLLLVRVRDNPHWYLPGGKIEPPETPGQAVVREVAEELQIELVDSTLEYKFTVVGPAYRQAGDVQLLCFSAEWRNDPKPSGEVRDVAWLGEESFTLFAPAVQVLFDGGVRGQ
jgi:8-oxo-dGTP diphosphatase